MSVKPPKAEVAGKASVKPFCTCTGVCGGQFGDAAADTFTLRPAAVMLVAETGWHR